MWSTRHRRVAAAALKKRRVSAIMPPLHRMGNVEVCAMSCAMRDLARSHSRDGGIGRRAGLKIQFWQQSGGSIPPPGTKLENDGPDLGPFSLANLGNTRPA